MAKLATAKTAPVKPGPAAFHGLPLVGGHPALDLVNTLEYRGRKEPNDVLSSFEDLVEWTKLAGLIDAADARRLLEAGKARPRAGKTACAKVRAFREHLRIIVGPMKGTVTHRDREASAKAIERAIAALKPRVRLLPQTGAIELDFPVQQPADLLARIVHSASELLVRRPRLRIRQCAGPNCDWMFVDATKAGHRRWCQARTCGNLARVRRFRNAR